MNSNEPSPVNGKRQEVLNGTGDGAGIREIESHIHEMFEEQPRFFAFVWHDLISQY